MQRKRNAYFHPTVPYKQLNWLYNVLQTLGLPAATKCFPAAEFYFNAQIKHFLAIKQILFDIIYVLYSHT